MRNARDLLTIAIGVPAVYIGGFLAGVLALPAFAVALVAKTRPHR